MTEKCDRAYYLSTEEFLIILYKYKITGLIFPKKITDASADGRSLKKAMNQLIKENRLYAEEDSRFRFSEDVLTWVKVLENAKESVVISGRDGSRELRYIYQDKDAAVILQMDDHHESWLRIEYIKDYDLDALTQYEDGQPVIKKYHRGESIPYESIGGRDNGIG